MDQNSKNTGINFEHAQNGFCPWVRSFCRIVNSCAPRPIKGDSLYISSDYSGDLPKSKYHVFSILLNDLAQLGNKDSQRRSIRHKFLVNNRRMSFKGLNDVYKQKALPYFLDYADSLEGVLVNILVSKQLKNLSHSDFFYEGFRQMNFLKAKWKQKSFEKMFNLVHFVSILINGLVRPGMNIYWYSDEDNLFASKHSSEDVAFTLSKLSSHYTRINLGELGIGTTKLNEPDFFEEDINAIPDLVAGSLSEFFDKVFELTDQNKLKDFAYMFPKNLSSKADSILQWLAYSRNNLRKVTVVFDRYSDIGGYKVWRFDTATDPRI